MEIDTKKTLKINKFFVFSEYRDKQGIGTEKLFDTEGEAVDYAKNFWEHLNEYDRKSYEGEGCYFMVYEIGMTDEQFSDYILCELECTLEDLWVRDVTF